MGIKNIERIVEPGHLHWVGEAFRMKNVVPFEVPMERLNPFIGIEYAEPHFFKASDKPRGARAHPHRGFETVSIMYKGSIAHNDSAGGGGVINEGETQWMTAASGVLHKEYLEEKFNKDGGDMSMVQLWINLPSKYKMTAPRYQAATRENMATAQLSGEAGTVEVVTGEYNGIKGTTETFSPINLYNAKIKKGGSASFSFPENYNTGMLLIEGNIKVNGKEEIKNGYFGLFENKGTEIEIEALDDTTILVLSGEPLNEPIAAYGPFVMNTKDEIQEAIADYNLGKFGYLED